MALVNSKTVNATKKAADLAAISTSAAKTLLEVFNPQNKNLFEMTLSPQNISANNAAFIALDTAMTTVYVQSIDVPFFSLEYIRYNHEQGVLDIEYPSEMTIRILDNEVSFARIYIQKWMAATVNLKYYTGIPGDYVFKDNQNEAKKTAIIIPQMTTGLPSLCWIKVEGMRYKSLEPLSFAQDDPEPLILSLTCAIDNIKLYSPANPLL
jgi:hypothetical protein